MHKQKASERHHKRLIIILPLNSNKPSVCLHQCYMPKICFAYNIFESCFLDANLISQLLLTHATLQRGQPLVYDHVFVLCTLLTFEIQVVHCAAIDQSYFKFGVQHTHTHTPQPTQTQYSRNQTCILIIYCNILLLLVKEKVKSC